MLSSGSKKRVFIAGWIMAGLVLLAYNGFQFMNIFSQSIQGYSGKVKELKIKLSSLNEYEKKAVELTWPDMDKKISAYLKKVSKNTFDISGKIGKNKSAKENIVLPRIEGIVKTYDIYGNVRLYVIIDGKRFGVGDRVYEFRINDITYDSVTFTKGVTTWCVPTPDVPYTFANMP